MADKELDRVRINFVERVSKEVIKQLLDDLLEDDILNEGEKDSILEENVSRADRARCLIDTVKKKGGAASRKMITSIQKRDKTLYSQLGLSCAAEALKMQEQTTTHTSTTEKVQRKKRNEEDIYPVTQDSFRNRVALLVNNIEFNKRKTRHGAEKDEENMEKLLKHLGYKVVKHRDLTGKEIDDALNKFSKHPNLEATDSVVVVIMSHGKMGALYGVSEKTDEFPIDNIYEHLGSQNCPHLVGKPKVIIIEACRGDDCGSVLISDGAEAAGDKDREHNTLQTVCKEKEKESKKDFITLLSSTPDASSFRDDERGSYFIQFIVEIFNNAAREDHIQELFRKVLRRFEGFSMDKNMQMPCIEGWILPRHFYFFPVDQDV